MGEESVPQPLAAGSAFGPYRVLEQLGKGGMASVYRGYEAALDRYVALKVLPAEFLHDESFAERFQREARVIAKLEHPNIIPIFSFGLAERTGTPWMAMRLISGGTLSSLLKTRRLPYREVARIIRHVAEALEYAHRKGVVHRDVKPQNVLMDESGGVYLADFGIARMLESGPGLTATGMITGTPNYMAPEQATGGTVDHRCDIYALGVVAYEMLTGQVPFSADTPVAVLMKHVSDPIPLLPADSVPEPLFRPVLKCLAKDPSHRWSQATEFARALEEGLAAVEPGEGPTRATRLVGSPHGATLTGATAEILKTGPTVPRLIAEPPPPPRSRAVPIAVALALTALLAFAGIGAGVFFLVLRRPATLPERTAVAVPTAKPIEPVETATAAPTRTATAEAAATLPPVPTAEAPTRAPQASPKPTERADAGAAASSAPGAAQDGLLQLRVKPWAEVSVDDKVVGVTPLRALSLAAGSYTVRLEHPDFKPVKRKVTVRPGETVRLEVDMTWEAVPKR